MTNPKIEIKEKEPEFEEEYHECQWCKTDDNDCSGEEQEEIPLPLSV